MNDILAGTVMLVVALVGCFLVMAAPVAFVVAVAVWTLRTLGVLPS